MKVAKSLLDLKEKCENLSIEMKESPLFPLINLTYSQVESPKFDPFTMLCRGLVVDKNTMEIVGRPFTRFFNFGEGRAELEVLEEQTNLEDMTSLFELNKLYETFEQNDAEILKQLSYYEKVDGSLVKIYFYPVAGKWLLGTKGQAVCETKVSGRDFSFYNLFLQALNLESDLDLQDFMNLTCDKNNTYLFELTSKYNKVVVQHNEPKAWFLGSVDNETGLVVEESVDHDFSKVYQEMPNVKPILKPKKYSFNNIKEAEVFSQNLPFDDEGYVIYYKKQPTFKIKSPAYVQSHLMSGSDNILKESSTIKLVFLNELGEYLTYFKQHADEMLSYKIAKEQMVKDILTEFLDSYQFNLEQRQYALMIKNLEFKNFHFILKRYLDEELEKSNLTFDKKQLLIHTKIEECLASLSDRKAYSLLTDYMNKRGLERKLL
jgi:putative bifunctional polynucleotide kinase/RNA ligase